MSKKTGQAHPGPAHPGKPLPRCSRTPSAPHAPSAIRPTAPPPAHPGERLSRCSRTPSAPQPCSHTALQPRTEAVGRAAPRQQSHLR